jgi:pimeloyl-ACP methyl ester carboxylesterase
LLIVVKSLGDNVCFPDHDHLAPVLGSTHVLVLNPRFTEVAMTPAQYADLERTAALTGRTMAAMQVWDVIRAVRWAFEDQKLSPSSVHVFGRGAAGIVALYAALFEERISQIILSDPPVSHWQGPALLTILRHTDIPEVAGLLAPRRLTFLRQVPAGFELTRQLFGVAGAETNLRQMDSLAEAVWL